MRRRLASDHRRLSGGGHRPLGFVTMIVVSLYAARVADGLSRTFARMHVPERLGMGIERLPKE